MDRSRRLAFALAVASLTIAACSGGGGDPPCCSITSYSVSGTISYAGARTGRIYVTAYPITCAACAALGTSIPAAGSYTIRGFEPGDYVLEARLDSGGQGVRNASDPTGSATTTVVSTNVTNGNLALLDPAPPTPVVPASFSASGGDGAVVLLWDPPTAAGVESATSYDLSWGTDAAATDGGVFSVAARDDGHYLHGGLANGGVLRYKIRSRVGGATSGWSAVMAATVGPVAGDHTLSGSVSFPGTVAAGAPLYVGVLDDATGDMRVTRCAPPLSSPVPFTVSGVAAGSVTLFAIVDQDSDGVADEGDLENTQEGVPLLVAGDTSGIAVTLGRSAAFARTRTQHGQGSYGDWYAVDSRVTEDLSRAVKVTLVAGSGMVVPMDLPRDEGFGVTANLGPSAPAVGQEYRFQVEYADGTSELLTSRVTAVLGSLARNLAVDTAAPNSPDVPLFTWAPPASPPAGAYGYALSVWGNGASWWYPASNAPLPSTTLSARWDEDGWAVPATLGPGTYTWSVSVLDANGNVAWKEATYTVP